jgi:hypothetical protein
MKQTVTKSMFVDAFQDIRPDNFSHSGLSAMYDYLNDYERETGQELELDVVAICCDFSEHNNILELAEEYGEEFDNTADALEWLRENTIVIEHPSGIIIQDF